MSYGSRRALRLISFVTIAYFLALLRPASSCAPTTDNEGEVVVPVPCSNCPSIYSEMCDGQETACACTCPNTIAAMFQVIRDDAAAACETSYTCPATSRTVFINSGTRTMQAAGSSPQLTCADPGGTWVDPSGNTVTGVTCADECAFCPLNGFYRDNCNGIVGATNCQSAAMVTITQTRNDVTGGCDIFVACSGPDAYAIKADGTAIFVNGGAANFACTDASGLFIAPTPSMSPVVGALCGTCANCPLPYANNCNGLPRMTCPNRNTMGISDTFGRIAGGCTYELMCGALQTIIFPTAGGMMVDPAPMTTLSCLDSPTDGPSFWQDSLANPVDFITCASAF